MTSYYGGNLQLKLGNGATPEVFTLLGGLRITQMQVQHESPNAGNRENGIWRTLLSAAGTSFVSITGTGAFTDSVSEDGLRQQALSGTTANWKILFPNNDSLTGPFLVSRYVRTGDIEREEQFSVTLESAGPMVYVSG